MDIKMKKQEIEYIDLLRLKEETFNYFTEEDSLIAVRDWGYNLDCVKYQTPLICLEAVKNHGFTLQFVHDQTEEICLAAYKQNLASVQYIRIDIKDETLRKAREEYFKYFTREKSLIAVRRNGYNLVNVKYQTPEICLEAVKYNGYALQYVINQTEEICLEAYKQKPNSIIFIRDSLEAYRKRRLNLIETIL